MSEHGTRGRYVNEGCRCELCSIANAKYQREWWEAHKPKPPRDYTETGNIVRHLESLHEQGFTWTDMAAACGTTSRVLWGIRNDQQFIHRILLGRLRRLTIADKPRLPVQQRMTPRQVDGIRRARKKRGRPEHRTVGIICPACGAHVCPLDPHRKTCGAQTCVQATRGRRHTGGLSCSSIPVHAV